MLFAAGLITGEALVGIFMAIPIVLSGDGEVLAISTLFGADVNPFGGTPGLIVVGGIAYMMYRIAAGKRKAG